MDEEERGEALPKDESPGETAPEQAVSLSKEEYDLLVETAAHGKQAVKDKENLVDEIKNLRAKKGESTDAPDEKPVEVVVEEALARQRLAQLRAERQRALELFRLSKSEFKPENDQHGFKFDAYERVLRRFAVTDDMSLDAYNALLSDAYKLLSPAAAVQTTTRTPAHEEPQGGGPGPKKGNDTRLSLQEKKFVETSFGGDVERYLKEKAKRPDYYDELLRWVR